MDRLLKLENMDLHLTPYRVLATQPDEGMLEFIPSSSLAQVTRYWLMIITKATVELPEVVFSIRVKLYANCSFISWLSLLIQVIVSSQILSEHRTITSYLQKFHPDEDGPFGITAQCLETFIKSCAGYSVITYIMGVGDRFAFLFLKISDPWCLWFWLSLMSTYRLVNLIKTSFTKVIREKHITFSSL